MPQRHRRSTGGTRLARRRTTWATVTGTHSVPAANGYDSIDLLAQYKATVGASTAGITIARIHLHTALTTGFTATSNNLVEGVIVTDQNDIGTNVVGAPRPAADIELDWMLWKWWWRDVNGGFTQDASANWEHDIRSMRKMHQVGNTLAHVVQVPASAAFPATVQVTGRVLLMLP